MESDVDRLISLVQHYRACWDTWPEYSMVQDEKRQIGFAVDLYGTHEAGVEHPQPGCSHCQRVYDALQEIAVWTLPKDLRPSSYEISSFDHSIGYSPAHGNRPEIIVTIRILHGGGGLDNPVDPCEIRCLREIEAVETTWCLPGQVERRQRCSRCRTGTLTHLITEGIS